MYNSYGPVMYPKHFIFFNLTWSFNNNFNIIQQTTLLNILEIFKKNLFQAILTKKDFLHPTLDNQTISKATVGMRSKRMIGVGTILNASLLASKITIISLISIGGVLGIIMILAAIKICVHWRILKKNRKKYFVYFEDIFKYSNRNPCLLNVHWMRIIEWGLLLGYIYGGPKFFS